MAKTVYGVAMRNFTRYPEMPSAQGLMDYGVRMEKLGYESLWAWDHILLGVEPNFPIIESLSILTAIAARTAGSRRAFDELLAALLAAGYFPYRLPTFAQGILERASPGYRVLLARIWHAVDPQGLLADGRYTVETPDGAPGKR